MDADKLCPKCGVAIKEGMEFCGECGARLTKSCPGCSATIRWHLKHCPKCGVNIRERLATIEAKNERKIQQKEEKLLRKKAWWKKHGWKVVASIVVAVAGLGVNSYLKSDAYAYLQAEKLYNSEDYSGAVSAFEALGDYRDSHSRILECYLGEAELYVEQGNLDSAGVIIQTLLKGEESISADLDLLLQSCPGIGAYLLPGNMAFASIPSGRFEMGSPYYDSERDSDEGPVHTVNIQSFEIMTTEVTQGMWEEVMGTTIQQQQSLSEFDYGLYGGTGPDYPMYYVSWNDCQEFVDAMNDLYPSHTYRLPSEAEWEYACRQALPQGTTGETIQT